MSDTDVLGEATLRKWAKKKEQMEFNRETAEKSLTELVRSAMSPNSQTRRQILLDLRKIVNDNRISTFKGGEYGSMGVQGVPESEKNAIITGFERAPWEEESDIEARMRSAKDLLRETRSD